MSNRIVKGGYGRLEEGGASENINLGALVEYGGVNDFQNHSVTGDDAMRMFATEAANPARQVDDTWNAADGIITANDQMTVQHMPKGAKVYAWLDAGEDVAEGAALESAGNGALCAKTTQADGTIKLDPIVAYAHEAVNNAGGGVPVRINVIVA